jgi:hypothetical protein
MKKLVLNLAALAVVATGGLSLATPAAATTDVPPRATCTEGDIVLTGSKCAVVEGHCSCTG